jgi:hypothetical protein
MGIVKHQNAIQYPAILITLGSKRVKLSEDFKAVVAITSAIIATAKKINASLFMRFQWESADVLQR